MVGPLERLACAVLLPLIGGLAAAQAGAQGCTIDGQPTALADGSRAVLASDTPTAATTRTWAPFLFTGSYDVHMVVRLTEDRAQLRAGLPPEALKRPWLWQFGDGTHAIGWTVAHRY